MVSYKCVLKYFELTSIISSISLITSSAVGGSTSTLGPDNIKVCKSKSFATASSSLLRSSDDSSYSENLKLISIFICITIKNVKNKKDVHLWLFRILY